MGFFETLRSISSSGVHDSERAFKKYLFVFSGAVDLHDLTSGRNSPLANVCKSVYLGDFDLLGTEYLVSNLSQVAPLCPGLAEYIHRHARGHPYLTQRICALIEGDQRGRKAGERQITLRDVDRAVDQMYEDDENLRYVSLQLERHEQAAGLLRQVLVQEQTVPFSLIDGRVARLFVIGAIRREEGDGGRDGRSVGRAYCAIRNPIYERALRQYLGFAPAAPTAGRESWVPDVDDYAELTLHVHGEEAPFVATAEAWGSSVSGEVSLDVDSVDAQELVARVGQGRAQEGDLVTLGTLLWEGVRPLGTRYAACRDAVEGERGVRIVLDIEPAALASLPWEYLYDPQEGRFPALSLRTPLARCVKPRQPAWPYPLLDQPLRILVVRAAPIDGPEMGKSSAREQVIEGLAALPQGSKIQVQVLQHATVGSLQEALHRPHQVLHYVGPGGWRAGTREGTLSLEADGGEAHPISAAQLEYLIRDTSVRMVVLDVSQQEGMGVAVEVAGVLVAEGLPAAVALQLAISGSSATIFATEFYRALAEGWPVDVAVAEGRKAVMAATDLGVADWGSPALLLGRSERVLAVQRPGRE
jgi:hypothetical protein